MWTGRTEIHLRPDVKCGSHAETIFMKPTITRYVVVDMPCTEMYLNGTRFVESTDKIYCKPLIKIQFLLNRLLPNSELLNGIRRGSSAPDFTQIGQDITESRVEIH